MKRSEVTVAALKNAGWMGPLGRMVSLVHKGAAVACGKSADHEFRHAVVDGEVAISVYRPLEKKLITLSGPTMSRKESFRKACRSDCD